MSGVLNLEFPISVKGANGGSVWIGCGILDNVKVLLNSDTGTSETLGRAMAWDNTKLAVQPWSQSLSVSPVQQLAKVKRSISGTDLFAGVAVSSATTGKPIVVAGNGSIVAVAATADGAVRNYLIANGTFAGQVTPQATTPATNVGMLGRVVKIRGVVGGTTDSGSATELIAAVNIW